MCLVWSLKKQSLNVINSLIFVTETKSVFCEVGFQLIMHPNFSKWQEEAHFTGGKNYRSLGCDAFFYGWSVNVKDGESTFLRKVGKAYQTTQLHPWVPAGEASLACDPLDFWKIKIKIVKHTNN